MSDCREIEPLLAGYVDGEVRPDERASVEAHIERCPPCRRGAEAGRTARDVVTSHRPRLRACAPANLKARCALHRASRGTPRWQVLVPLSLAATVLLAVGAVFLYSAVNQVGALAAQVTADHVKCAKLGSPGPGDPVAAAAAWQGRHGWPIQVPAGSRADDLEFLTVRRCLVTDGSTAHIMYRWKGEPMSVFVLPTPVDALGAQQILDRFGHEAAMWSAGGRTYVVVARAPRAAMEPVVRYVRANVR